MCVFSSSGPDCCTPCCRPPHETSSNKSIILRWHLKHLSLKLIYEIHDYLEGKCKGTTPEMSTTSSTALLNIWTCLKGSTGVLVSISMAWVSYIFIYLVQRGISLFDSATATLDRCIVHDQAASCFNYIHQSNCVYILSFILWYERRWATHSLMKLEFYPGNF